MVLPYKGSLPQVNNPLATLTQEKFDRGVVSLIDESKLPRNALKEANNITLAEDGAPTVRPGLDWYGIDLGSDINGGDMFVDPTTDAPHLVAALENGTIVRSLDNGTTWTLCTGATLTAGKKVRMEQTNEYMYIFNGWDNIVRYDGSTTLQTYTALTTPTGGSAVKTGLAATTYTYRYRVSAVNDIGYTIASVAATVQVSKTRDQFSSTDYVTFTWSAVTGAVRYDVYVGQITDEEVYIDSVEGQATTTYVDQGQALEQVAVLAPDSNTTQGPKVGDMATIGTRLYATADKDNPYRVWISGAGRFVGMFSSAYEATYIDLQKGGQYKPVKVEDYRDGKGTPLATVWCKSKDGRGCIWQGTLESFTIGDVTFPVPNFYRLPGSRGTDAPDSVVNVLNDYMYYNSQAFYNLGSRAQFLNLLSTDEVSANIRPDVQNVRPAQSHKIAAHFQDAKVYFSVPINDDDNDVTIIYDTERRAWLPRGFTVGFERFFTYTDTDGSRHLMVWKPGDSRFSEISENIRGDYGAAFETVLSTGLMQVNPRDRMAWLWCTELEIEFAQPRGEISIELSGMTREEGFKTIVSLTMEPDNTSQQYTRDRWSIHAWALHSDASLTSYSEPSTKRYSAVQEDINAYQFRITTNSTEADYIMRTLQLKGRTTLAGKPSNWELFED